MKSFVMGVMAVLVLAVQASAADVAFNVAEMTCVARGSEGYPQSGFRVKVVSDVSGENKMAVIIPICKSCIALPNYIPLTSDVVAGMLRVVEGPQFRLSVVLESFVPTKTHPASLYSSMINGGSETQLSCTMLK